MPEIMFRYRSAMILIRTHCPEVIMGMQSREELEDVALAVARPAEQLAHAIDVASNGGSRVRSSPLNERIGQTRRAPTRTCRRTIAKRRRP